MIYQGSIVTLAGSKIDTVALNFVIMRSLKTCIAVGYIMAKAEEPYVNNDPDTNQNKAVNLAGQIVTPVKIAG
jgi:hypothetical protein